MERGAQRDKQTAFRLRTRQIRPVYQGCRIGIHGDEKQKTLMYQTNNYGTTTKGVQPYI